jgi:hypothetical protein
VQALITAARSVSRRHGTLLSARTRGLLKPMLRPEQPYASARSF